MKQLLIKLFTKLLDVITNRFKWLSDNIQSWLTPILKALGLGGVGILSFDSFRSAFDDGVDRFGLFARLFQIDDILGTINNAFNSIGLSNYLNVDFLGICSAFGIIVAINQILNAIAWAVLVSIALFCVKLFVMGSLEIVKIAGLKKV